MGEDPLYESGMLKLMCLYPSRNLRAIGSRKKLALDEGRRCRALDFPDEDRDVSVGPLECSTSDELAATVFRVQVLWVLVQTSVT